MDNNTVVGSLIGSLLAAIGWLGKRLYDSPRPSDVEAMRVERDELRKVVNQYADEQRQLAKDRDTENRKLREELAELRATVERRTESGGRDALARPIKRRARQPVRRS